MKTALITGASTGAGPGIAKVLSANGYQLMLASKREEKLLQLLPKLDGIADYHLTDVVYVESIRLLVKATIERFGKIDVFVNNSGFVELSNFKDMDARFLDKMIDINFRSHIWATYEILPEMVERGGGHIVNISGILANKSMRSAAVYSATEAAIKAFNESLRQELTDEQIRVTTIYPGGIKSDAPRAISDQIIISGGKGLRGFGLLEPEAVGDAVLYALEQPQSVSVNEIVLRPAGQRV